MKIRSKKKWVANRKGITDFAGEQFNQLMRKNLRVPVKLYHL